MRVLLLLPDGFNVVMDADTAWRDGYGAGERDGKVDWASHGK
jgi:hypothetical protein